MIARRLAAPDAAAWHALMVSGAAAFPSGFLQSDAKMRAIPPERRPAILNGGDWHGVFADDTLIGIAALRIGGLTRTSHRASIGPFHMTAAWQGTGAADRLMDHLAAVARAAGVVWLDLWVAAGNGRAAAFYRRHRFETVATRPDAVRRDGLSEDDLLMTRRLEPPAPPG